jgi:hypothetical protein
MLVITNSTAALLISFPDLNNSEHSGVTFGEVSNAFSSFAPSLRRPPSFDFSSLILPPLATSSSPSLYYSAYILKRIAHCCWQIGHLDKGLIITETALNIHDILERREGSARFSIERLDLLCKRGILLHDSQNFESAYAPFREALTAYTAMNLPLLQARTLNDLGTRHSIHTVLHEWTLNPTS